MRRQHAASKITMALMALAVGLVGCGSDAAVPEEPGEPAPTQESTVRPPGAYSQERDEMLDGLPDTTVDETGGSQDASQDGVGGEIPAEEDPRSEEHRVDDPEDRRDKASSREAYDRGLAQSAELDDGLAQQYAAPEDFTELEALGFDWWIEREQVIGERLAEVATTFYPNQDFHRDEAWMRATYLMDPAIHPSTISEYPAADTSWVTARKCNADAEVFVQHQAVDEDAVNALPVFQVLAEYRWVDGDAGCELVQPEYFYEYNISLGGSGLATKVERTVLDDQLHDRPSGWDM